MEATSRLTCVSVLAANVAQKVVWRRNQAGGKRSWEEPTWQPQCPLVFHQVLQAWVARPFVNWSVGFRVTARQQPRFAFSVSWHGRQVYYCLKYLSTCLGRAQAYFLCLQSSRVRNFSLSFRTATRLCWLRFAGRNIWMSISRAWLEPYQESSVAVCRSFSC